MLPIVTRLLFMSGCVPFLHSMVGNGRPVTLIGMTRSVSIALSYLIVVTGGFIVGGSVESLCYVCACDCM